MRVASKERVLEYRYELYCRAHDAYESGAASEHIQALHALAHRCRRTAEMIQMAELLVENRYPKLAMAHIGEHYATCQDCLRKGCLTAAELAAPAPATAPRLVA